MNGASLSAGELDEAVAALSFEDARSELVEIVAQLEQGNIALEQSMAMWERGEALARRCEAWLVGARARLDAARMVTDDFVANLASCSDSAPSTSFTPNSDSVSACDSTVFRGGQ